MCPKKVDLDLVFLKRLSIHSIQRMRIQIRLSADCQVDFKGNGISIKIQHNKIWKKVFKERSVGMMVRFIASLDDGHQTNLLNEANAFIYDMV